MKQAKCNQAEAVQDMSANDLVWSDWAGKEERRRDTVRDRAGSPVGTVRAVELAQRKAQCNQSVTAAPGRRHR